MAIAREHEIHRRRLGRNVGVALCLLAFVGIVFALSVVKIERGGSPEAFDHAVRPALEPQGLGSLDAPVPLEPGR